MQPLARYPPCGSGACPDRASQHPNDTAEIIDENRP